MPYNDLLDLPETLHKYPIEKQKAWMETFNAHENDGEETAHKIANGILNLKTFEDSYLGTLPKMNQLWSEETTFANAKVKFSGVDYTDAGMVNYLPLMAVWDGRVIDASTGTIEITNAKEFVSDLMSAWEAGRVETNQNQPLGVDYSHINYKKESPIKELIGYVTDLKPYEGKLQTYFSGGQLADTKTPENTIYIMAKVAWLEKGQTLLSQGSMPYPSIVFGGEPGNLTIGKPTICASPADNTIPPWVMCEKQERIEMDAKQELLSLIESLDEASIASLLEYIKSMSNPTEPNEAAQPEQFTSEMIAWVKAQMAKDVPAVMETKEEPVVKPDEGITTARAFLASRPEIKLEEVDKQAKHFEGMTKDVVINALEARFASIPKPGAQILESGKTLSIKEREATNLLEVK